MNWQQVIPLVVGLVFGLLFLLFALRFVRVLRLWMRAKLTMARITLPAIILMELRRSDSQMIVDRLIQLSQGGIRLPVSQLESAALRGANLERVVLAAITAKNNGDEIAFDDLVAADLQDQLADLLDLDSK